MTTAPALEKTVAATKLSRAEQPNPKTRDRASGVGGALRRHRAARGMSLRQLARDLGVSASFISQLENGKSQPSVATLFAICSLLDVTVDQVFNESAAGPGRGGRATKAAVRRSTTSQTVSRGADDLAPPAVGSDPVVHAADRHRLVLDTGVTWERLGAAQGGAPGEFLLITYEAGGSSTAGNELSRHNGTDYVFVVSGEITLTLGFETYTLRTDDSISFDSSIPHRLRNDGTKPAQAVCFVLSDTLASPRRNIAVADPVRKRFSGRVNQSDR